MTTTTFYTTAPGTPKLFGYVRVSHKTQDPSSQVEELKKHGCDPADIFQETISSSSRLEDRHQLMNVVSHCRLGDTLIATEFSRLGRDIGDLERLARMLLSKGATLKIAHSSIVFAPDQSGGLLPTTELILTLMASISRFEKRLTRERCEAGISAYRQAGGKLGRHPKLDDKTYKKMVKQASKPGANKKKIAKKYGISLSSVYKACQSERSMRPIQGQHTLTAQDRVETQSLTDAITA